jgi:2-oxoglutarate ferredoxin oxidoreductase subunit beta
VEGKCFSFVEVVSTCPTNWGLTPLDSLKWAEDNLLPYYELGDYKVPE